MRKSFLTTIWALIGAVVYSQEYHICHPKDNQFSPRERIIDMHHLKLEIEPEAMKGIVHGFATLHFTPLMRKVDSIWLDAIRFNVHSIKLNGKPVSFVNADSGLAIFPDYLRKTEANFLEIKYTAAPEKGIYFTGWDDPTGKGRKQIWTQGQGIDHRHWLPYYDEQHDKLTTEIVVHFDSRYKVVSNGTLLSADTIRDKIRWHYLQDKPHPGYLIMVAIGDYTISKTTCEINGRRIDFEEYMYPDVAGGDSSTYRYSRFFMQKLEELLRLPYPWPGPYKQVPVVDFIYGAMENTGAVIFAESLISDPYSESIINYHQVNAHEMAHQWFGNLVTAWSARHHWLHESFATYFDLLSVQWLKGDYAFSNSIRSSINTVKSQEIIDNFPIAHSTAGNARHYQKGGIVLHMLRNMVGDTAFYKTLQVFLERHQFRNVHSDDLLYAFHEVTGRDLQWFWDQWFYGSGMPEVSFSYNVVSDKKGKQLLLNFRQKNVYKNDSTKAFRMQFDVEIFSSKRRFIIPIQTSKLSDTLVILLDNDESVLMVNPDPGKQQLIEWKEIQNPIAIAKYSDNGFDKVFAYMLSGQEFRLSDFEYFKREKDPYLLALWARAIGKNVMNPLIWNFFLKADSEEAKYIALQNTDYKFWRARPESELLEFSDTKDYNMKILALLKAINARPEKIDYLGNTIHIPSVFTTQTLHLKYAFAAYIFDKKDERLQHIASFVSPEYQGSLRVEAIKFLSLLNYYTDELIRICVHALGHYDRSLPGVAAKYLKNVPDKRKKNLIETELKKYEKIWPEWKTKRARKLLLNA